MSRYIVWETGAGYSEFYNAKDYDFKNNLKADNDGNYFMQDEYGKITITKDKYLAQQFYDDADARKRGERVYLLDSEDAISFIAKEMENADNNKGIAEFYSDALKKLSYLLED